MLSPMFNIQNI